MGLPAAEPDSAARKDLRGAPKSKSPQKPVNFHALRIGNFWCEPFFDLIPTFFCGLAFALRGAQRSSKAVVGGPR